MGNVVIRGDGVAAYCCAHLLQAAGFRVSLEQTDRRRLPAILLGEAALALIRDVFEQKDLFRDLPRIEKRVVAWGPHSTPVTLDHSAVVVSEQLLLESLRPGLDKDKDDPADTEAAWTVFASRPLPAGVVEHHFGSRHASAAPVELKASDGSAACCIESLENGWMFLIPMASSSGWLLSVGGPPEELLNRSRSRVIAGRIVNLLPASGEFPAYPRVASPLGGPGWLACGTAAMAFDPICGDGTAHAIREAILTTAVIRAAAQGSPTEELFSHYEARLMTGFERHLALCLDFYKSGACGPWWHSEIESVQRGREWCARRSRPEFRYRLEGFELRALR